MGNPSPETLKNTTAFLPQKLFNFCLQASSPIVIVLRIERCIHNLVFPVLLTGLSNKAITGMLFRIIGIKKRVAIIFNGFNPAGSLIFRLWHSNPAIIKQKTRFKEAVVGFSLAPCQQAAKIHSDQTNLGKNEALNAIVQLVFSKKA
jgi:hypothetical protein